MGKLSPRIPRLNPINTHGYYTYLKGVHVPSLSLDDRLKELRSISLTYCRGSKRNWTRFLGWKWNSLGIQSPNLRMVSWNLNTFRFVSVIGSTPNHHHLTFGEVFGSLGIEKTQAGWCACGILHWMLSTLRIRNPDPSKMASFWGPQNTPASCRFVHPSIGESKDS